jgi:hypothetical protein
MNYYLQNNLSAGRDACSRSFAGGVAWHTCRAAYTLFCVFLLLAMANAAYAQNLTIPGACNTQLNLNTGSVPGTTISADTDLGGRVTDQSNIISPSTADYATMDPGLAGNVQVDVKVPTGQYVAGTFASFDIEAADFATGNPLQGIIVTTFLNGNRQESSLSLNVGLAASQDVALVTTGVTGQGRQRVGFVTTKPFDQIRIFYNRNVSARLYGAVVETRCQLPALECNQPVTISFPEARMSEYAFQAGICLAGISNLGALSTSDPEDFVRITDGAQVGCAQALGVRIGQVMPAGTFAGFEFEQNGILSITVSDFANVVTLLNGVVQERKVTTDLIDAQWFVATRRVLRFKTTKPFDEIRYEQLGVVTIGFTETKVFRAVVEKACPGPELVCNEWRFLTRPKHAVRTRSYSSPYLGVVGCSATILFEDKLINDDIQVVYDANGNVAGTSQDDAAYIQLIQANQCFRNISVIDDGQTYPAGTFAAAYIANTSLFSLNTLNTRLTLTYLNGNFQETQVRGIDVDLISLKIAGAAPEYQGFKTTKEFNEIRYQEYSFFTPFTFEQTFVFGMAVMKQCDGPVPVCITPPDQPIRPEDFALINRPRYPITISTDPNLTPLGVSVCSNRILNPEAMVDGDPNNYASLEMTGLLCIAGISFDLHQQFPAGLFVGVDIEPDFIASVNLGEAVTVSTYLNGQLQDGDIGILSTPILGLGGKRRIVGFVTTKPFDRVSYTQGTLAEFTFGGTLIRGLVMRQTDPTKCTAPTVAIVSPANNSTVATNSPVVSGTATRLSSVTVTSITNSATIPGKSIVTTADASGYWSIPALTFSFAPGSQTVTAVASNSLGTSTQAQRSFIVEFDGTTLPRIAILNPVSGSLVTVSNPTVNGTGTPNASVTLTRTPALQSNDSYDYVNETTLTIDGAGNWSTNQFTFENQTGDFTITAVVSNPAGTAQASTSFTVGGIRVLINTPANGSKTSDETPLVSGTGFPGATVTLTRTPAIAGRNNVITVTVDGAGNWSTNGFDYTERPGISTIDARMVDGFRVASAKTIFEITAPTVTIDFPANGSVLPLVNFPVIRGTGVAGGIVSLSRVPTVFDETNSVDVTVDINGNWSTSDFFFPRAGANTITAEMRRTVNGSPISTTVSNFAFITNQAPTVSILTPPLNGTVKAEGTVVNGLATPGSVVRITGSNGVVGAPMSVTADLGGNWSTTALTFGSGSTQSLTAVATNQFGTSSPAVRTFAVFARPVVAIVTPAANSTVTSGSVVVSGTATPNAVVVVDAGFDAQGGPVSVTANASGNWSTSGLIFAEGPRSVTAVASTIIAGPSVPAVRNFIVIDVPSPGILTPADGSKSAITTPLISGTATPNAVVIVTRLGSGASVSVTADASGSWSTSALTFPIGQPRISAVAVTSEGRSKPTIRQFEIGALPIVRILSPSNGERRSPGVVEVTGTAIPGSVVIITGGSGVQGGPVSVTIDGSGIWSTGESLTISANPARSVTATVTNDFGSSQVATTFIVAAVTVAIVSPAANSTVSTSPVISGTATAGAVVTVSGGAGSTGGPVSVTANGSGNWSTSGLTFAVGTQSVTAVASEGSDVSNPVTRDFVAVAAPPSVTISAPNNTTTSTTPVISGTTTPGIPVVIVTPNPTGPGTVTLCNTVSNGSGVFSCTLSVPAGPVTVTVIVGTEPSTTTAPISFTAIGGGSSNLLLLSPKVFLNGAYNVATGLMRDDLRRLTLIPLSDPYSTTAFASTFTHTAGSAGLATTAGVLSVTGTNAIVDWVFVELRNPGSGSAVVVATRAGLVQRDGDVVDVDGVSPLSFSVASGSYYVVVRHRNHLRIMARNSMMLSATATTVDFTNPNTPTMGAYGQLTIVGSTTVTAMWSGDANGDNLVIGRGGGSDTRAIITPVTPIPTRTLFGYNRLDVTMDGVANISGGNNDVGHITATVLRNPANPTQNFALSIAPGF